MQQEDDLRALAKIMEFGRAVSIFLLVVHVYVFCYPSIVEWHIRLEVIDKILTNFNNTTGIFNCILWSKLAVVLLLAISCLGTKGVKGEKITWPAIYAALVAGFILFFLNWWILELSLPYAAVSALYIFTLAFGYLCLLMAGLWMSRLYKHNLMTDVFNTENESFLQETRLMENEYSINLPTKFQYQGKLNDGWINVVNPFRATIVLGTPGSGKSYAVVNNYIRQMISKGYSCYIYDYKFDDLSVIVYNSLLRNMDKYKVKPHFYVINFDDPKKSHRCNPINPEFMTDISDAYEASYTIMLNLNRTWIEKQGDFFVESPIILLAAIIWYLKIYKDSIYCSFPHAVELLNKPYTDWFTILTSYPELENYLSPFMDAWKGGAMDQLQGQIASAKIPLTRMISPQLYWVMTGNLPKRVVDAERVTEHHAIIITDMYPEGLNREEMQLYLMIIGRMLEAFMPVCRVEYTTVDAICAARKFQCRSYRVIEKGWFNIFEREGVLAGREYQSVPLPEFASGETVKVAGCNLVHKKDLPVSAYTDAELIEYMDTAGLGTVATRTHILQTLIDRKYVRYSGKYIIPTRKGLYMYETVRGMKIANTALTSGWEAQLARMEQGKLSQEEFQDGVLELAGEITEEIFGKYSK